MFDEQGGLWCHATPPFGLGDLRCHATVPKLESWARAHSQVSVTVEGVQLNDRQLIAVTHPQTPLAVVAGPGSGKTRVLTERVAHLISSGAHPSRLLALTFTNKAAQEMRDRLEKMTGDVAASQCWVMTFHAFCVRFLRREHSRVGLASGFHIVDTEDGERLLRRILGETTPTPPDVRAAASRLRHEISQAKNRMVPLSLIGAGAVEYQRRLGEMAAVDFDDLLLFTLTALNDDDCRQRWVDRFDHVLVDEFQDTNTPQLEILTRLAGHRRVTVVGDAKQSVYGFRGAAPDVFDAFTERFAPVATVVLNQNYRSCQPVLDVCQALIPDGDNPLWSSRTDGARPALVVCGDDREEAHQVVTRIREATRTGVNPSEIAVLVRTHALTRVIEEELVRVGVAYRVVGGQRFYDRAEVRDVLAWLRWVVNPSDLVSFERAAGVPRRGVGSKTVDEVIGFCRSRAVPADGMWEQWPVVSKRARESLSAMFSWRSELLAGGAVTASGAVRRVLEAGVLGHWASAPDAETRLENLEQLVSAAAPFDSVADSLSTFLEQVALTSAADESGAGVQLMTIHAAKGREFDCVFVPGVEDGVLPHSNARNRQEVEEERRLLFVACSRARDTLTLSYARRRMVFGQVQERMPSPFLGEVAHLLEGELRVPAHRSGFEGRSLTWSGGRFRGGDPSLVKRSRATSPLSVLPDRSQSTSGRRPTPGRASTPGVIWSVGDLVHHPQFGDGVVVGVRVRDVEVRFLDRVRLLAADVAPLSRRAAS